MIVGVRGGYPGQGGHQGAGGEEDGQKGEEHGDSVADTVVLRDIYSEPRR